MSGTQPTIFLEEVYAVIDNELDDLATDDLISQSVYSKKSAKRQQLYAINAADRHICLQIALSSLVSVFVPKNLRTVFFNRQTEYVGKVIDAHAGIKDIDEIQFSYLTDETQYLDVISVLSNFAFAYNTLPVETAPEISEILTHGLEGQVHNRDEFVYTLSSGTQFKPVDNNRQFFVQPNSRKMVLSNAFDSDMWVQFIAQVAPVRAKTAQMTKGELDEYQVLAPYWTREWLINKALIEILPRRVVVETGYDTLEQQSKAEAFQNRPGTGNVIIEGDELGGNYESNFYF